MKIFSQMPAYQTASYHQRNNQYATNYNHSQLKCDTVSFGSMKKKEFQGIDRACVDRFKAPIEKFNTNQDLQNWAGKQLEPIMNKHYEGRFFEITHDREDILNDWKTHLNNPQNGYKNTEKLLIMSAITQPLDSTNEIMPPILNKEVLASVMDKVKNGEVLNINKTYKKELRKSYLNNKYSDKVGEWIIIPSKEKDAKNFNTNVQELKTLSNYTWCTHNSKAEPYLEKGDFHIYIENNQPKIGIRFIGNTIQEIQGEFNDGKIPHKYSKIVNEHIKNYKLSQKAENEIKIVSKTAKNIQTIKNDLSVAIQNNDAEEIFKYFGFIKSDTKQTQNKRNFFTKFLNIFSKNTKTKEQQKNTKPLTLDFYTQPGRLNKYAEDALDGNISFKDIGINEDKLFENVTYIKGYANFIDSELTSLHNLQVINGNAVFRESKIKDLGELTRIGGCADFSDSQVESLNKLEKIGGTATFSYSKITSLGQLHRIGGIAKFKDSNITDLGELQCIEGSAYFDDSPITSLKHLRKIGGQASFCNSKVTDLGELEIIGGNADFSDSILKDIKNLKQIRGKIFAYNTKLKSRDFTKFKTNLIK